MESIFYRQDKSSSHTYNNTSSSTAKYKHTVKRPSKWQVAQILHFHILVCEQNKFRQEPQAGCSFYSAQHNMHPTLLLILQYSTPLWYSPSLLLTPVLFSHRIYENVAAAYLNLVFSTQESVYSVIGSTCSVHTYIKSHLFTAIITVSSFQNTGCLISYSTTMYTYLVGFVM